MKNKIEPLMDKYLKMIETTFAEFPWEKQDFYTTWLSQTYYYARHTTRLLALGAARCAFTEDPFHNRFLEHAKEEKGHEKLIILDMKSFDMKPEDFPEFPSAAALYQSQYYWMQNDSPLAFFGYVLALEAIGARLGPALNQKVESAYNKKATHFVRVHSEEDIEHVEKALENIAKLPVPMQEIVMKNMEQTFYHYDSAMKECRNFVMAKKGFAKAS